MTVSTPVANDEVLVLKEEGTPRGFSVAGVSLAFHSNLRAGFTFALPETFRSFEDRGARTDVEVLLRSRRFLTPPGGTILYDSGVHWRVGRGGSRTFLEFYHPPSSRVYCRAFLRDGFRSYELLFDETTVERMLGSHHPEPGDEVQLWLPYPLDQLLVVPTLAKRKGALVHACGAVVGGKAYVFAGHSGDGKTTLSGLLDREGIEVLSDERIALRKQEDGYWAYGTPWPGQGDVVSPAFYPLGGIFLLRKAARHRIRVGSPARFTAELMTRSIVPYYFPDEAEQIVDFFAKLASSLPVRELEFSREPGIVQLLKSAS